jgi:hypothetical protein
MHDPHYQRPVLARYTDPLELVWMATARRLGLTIRRNPDIFSMTDGTGLLELAPRHDLDADDNAAQMLFHEICHWITNGVDSFRERDWGFPVSDDLDWREFSCLRVQAGLADRYSLRRMFGPTGNFRQYYDGIPDDVLAPMDDGALEAQIVARAAEALRQADGEPWGKPLREAFEATRTLRTVVGRFLDAYQTDLDNDTLPSLWGR